MYYEGLPLLVKFLNPAARCSKPFRLLNSWTKRSDFLAVVKEEWCTEVRGSWYRFVSKLKIVKRMLKNLREEWQTSDQKINYQKLKVQQLRSQVSLDPLNMNLVTKEREAKSALHSMQSQFETDLRQRSRVKRIQEGDSNSKFFHSSI